MEPKFQSSFIPKGPLATSGNNSSYTTTKEKSLLAFLAVIIFTLSLLSVVAAFGYKYYLNYSIERMGRELETSRSIVEDESVKEITRLNNRIIAAETLIDKHIVLSPLFRLLETSTVRNVRFSELSYTTSSDGIRLLMRGEARSYATLALQADLLNKSDFFSNPVFSDLSLDDKGNVVFSFEATVNQNLISYKREIEQLGVTKQPVVATSTATTTSATATSSGQTATSTRR